MFNPDDYTPEEIQHFASLGMQAEINRALSRLPREFVENFDGSEEQTRWLENYIKLNPGGRFSPTSVKVWKHEEGE
jgi:hypothetical protein